MTDTLALTTRQFLVAKLGTEEVTAMPETEFVSPDKKFKLSSLIYSGEIAKAKKSVFMLETSKACEVRIGKTKVFSLAHLEPNEIFFIDEEPYVVLIAGMAFINSHTPKVLESQLDETLMQKDQMDFPKTKAKFTVKALMTLQILGVILLNNVPLTDSSVAKEIPSKPHNLSQNERSLMLQDLEKKIAPAEVEIVEAAPEQEQPRRNFKAAAKPRSVSAQNQSLLESYVLEARFDPDSARQKVRDLARNQNDNAEAQAILAWLHKI